MFSKNLKYYRLKKGITKKELAGQIGVSSMAISNYENGTRKPNVEIINRLSAALGVKANDFLAVRNEGLVFTHGEFRKNCLLSLSEQEFIKESVEEYINRFMLIVEILGGKILPDYPEPHVLQLSDSTDECAESLRIHLGMAESGPIEDLIGKLEDKGIIVIGCNIESSKFSGMNGSVNGRPYIIYNANMNTERNRSTIGHELAHLMFNWPKETEQKEVESIATSIGGAFLFPSADAERELGIRRSSVTGDMCMVAKEYGISMFLLVKRAEQCGIVGHFAARDFYINASKNGWRTGEPSRIEPERPRLFDQFVLRAVSENEISIQRGAELLKVSYEEVAAKIRFSGVWDGVYQQ